MGQSTRTIPMFNNRGTSSAMEMNSVLNKSSAASYREVKELEKQLLNSTLLTDKEDFRRSPGKHSTFGNPMLREKFNRNVYCREVQMEFRGKDSPCPTTYYNDLSRDTNVNGFYV